VFVFKGVPPINYKAVFMASIPFNILYNCDRDGTYPSPLKVVLQYYTTGEFNINCYTAPYP